MSMCRLEKVEIPAVTAPDRTAVATEAAARGAPIILVHGILDSVWRWVTDAEAAEHGLVIPDWRNPLPPLAGRLTQRAGVNWSLIRPEGTGLLAELARQRRAAVGYSYQDLRRPVESMDRAVELLHRVAAWACDRWRSPVVDLVGYSRGGLVARHALHRDSGFMAASDFQKMVRSVVTICTPHRGSELAQAYARIEEMFSRLETHWPRAGRHGGQLEGVRNLLGGFRMLIANIGQLAPTAEEVVASPLEALPCPPGGCFAIAGSRPAYLALEVPLLGRLTLPPPLRFAEFRDGKGDMAVAVTSALAGRWTDQRTIPVNHVAAPLDARVHDAVVTWLR